MKEIANSITHGVGALLAIAAIPLCVVAAVHSGAACTCLRAGVQHLHATGICDVNAVSRLAAEKAKRVFKVLDHSFIYLFIAASYSPYCLVTLVDYHGVALFVLRLADAIIVYAESFWVFRPRWISAVLYLCLAGCCVLYSSAVALLPAPGFWLLLAGGLCYSIGCIFYVLKKIPYMHSIFHVWILAGSVCQFLSICLFVL